MVIIETIKRVTLSYDDAEDIIKFFEEGYGWEKVLGDTKHVTYETKWSSCYTTDDYRKAVMSE